MTAVPPTEMALASTVPPERFVALSARSANATESMWRRGESGAAAMLTSRYRSPPKMTSGSGVAVPSSVT